MSKKEEFEFDFDKDTSIDPHKLHEECFNYARMAWRYGEALEDAIKERDRLKLQSEGAYEDIKTVKAELLLKARSNPEECGLTAKPTVDTIEAWCITNDKYLKARKRYTRVQEELIDMNYKVGILKTGVNAIQFSKSTGLEGAIRLWEKEYFSIEGLPLQIPQDWQSWRKEQQAEVSKKQRQRMRRTTRSNQEE